MAIGVLVAKDLRRQWRDPKALILQLAVPLLITFVMGVSFGGGIFGRTKISAIPIAIVGGGLPAPLRERLAAGLQESGFFEVAWADSAAADDLVRRGRVQAALVLPPDLLRDFVTGREVELRLWQDPNSRIKAGIVETVLQEALLNYQAGEAAYRALWPDADPSRLGDDANAVADAFAGDVLPLWRALRDSGGEGRREFVRQVDRGFAFGDAMSTHAVDLVVRDRDDWEAPADAGREPNLFDYFLPSIAVFFMMFGVAAIVRDYHRERESRTLARVLLAPVTSLDVLLAKWSTAVIAGVVQLSVLFGAGALLFDMSLGRSPAALAAALALGCGAAASFYLVLGLLARTEKAMDALTTIATLVLGMIGGNFFPVELMPSALHAVGRVSFNYWANSAINDVVVHDAGLAAVAPQLGVLAVIAAAGLAIALGVLSARRRRGVQA